MQNTSLNRAKSNDIDRVVANLIYPSFIDYAGIATLPSLTIDYMNLNRFYDDSPINQKWISRKRNCGNIADGNILWTFKESYNKVSESHLNTGIVFNGQKLNIYIAASETPTFSINNEFVYSNPQISIFVNDFHNGTRQKIHEFSEISSPQDNSDRYIVWTCPSENNNAYWKNNNFGIYAIEVDVSYDFYFDAEYTNSLEADYSSKSYLWLQAFSSSKAFYDTVDHASIFSNAHAEFATIDDVFSATYFNDIMVEQQIQLDSDKKRAIILDQASFVLTSGLPILVADSGISRISGYGISQNSRSKMNPEKHNIYGYQHENSPKLPLDRSFGLNISPQFYNFTHDVNQFILPYTEQSLYDPCKMFSINEDGVIDDSWGIDGISVLPSLNIKLANILSDINPDSEMILDIPLHTSSIEIYNIDVVETDELSNEGGDYSLSIEFEIDNLGNIESIEYRLWTKNNQIYSNATVTESISSPYTFDYTEKILDYDNSLYDLITVMIIATDKDGKEHVFNKRMIFPDSHGITNISAIQQEDGSGIVLLDYVYKARSELNQIFSTIQYSLNGTSYITINEGFMDGGFGGYAINGYNLVKININKLSIPDGTKKMFFKIKIHDIDNIDSSGNNGIGIATASIDLSSPTVHIVKVYND